MKQLLVFLLLLCSASASAQDVIVKKDGSTIVCRVVEVTSTEITYKKWNNLNGSNYVMDKSLASAINYENGKKVNLSDATNLYTPNNQNDGAQQYNDRALLRLDAAINKSDKKAKKLRTIGWIGGGVLFATSLTIGIIADCGSTLFLGDEEVDIPFVATLAGSVVWTTSFLVAANHKQKEAQMLESSTIYQYDFNLSKGTSLSAGIDMINDHSNGERTIGLGLRYNF